ncbi:MAG: hypothetical protein EOP64_04860 [Sphingomonas sp.]|nr:MAG: hypothetical protein EOP64_04860 [Sphingomonas sp.]
MNREMLEQHLAMVEGHVTLGEGHIARQHELIVKLEQSGHESGEAISLLRSFKEMQEMHLAHRDRLKRELSV